MSLDPAGSLRSSSPASSGRASPVNRAPRRLIEDDKYKKDKAFRRYASGVERALSLYDSPQQEWADYISFLGRLLKAIQQHPPGIRDLPYGSIIATRLAQCLNPSLPSGVHQKALEVHAYIFSVIGKDGLAREFPVYFPGLSSVLSFASLSVRPLFLSLIETYVLALEAEVLRPALKAVILCLLPGLEEETSEDFERILQILDELNNAISGGGRVDDASSEPVPGNSFFWQCLFLAIITNPSRRQGALAYLSRKLPKLGVDIRHSSFATTPDEAKSDGLSPAAHSVIFPEPGLLVRCFAAGLSDRQLLIQRGFLDLLVTHLPLNSPVLQGSVSDDDLERLVAAAAHVVARRDMSLNRRLWAWFLGPEPKVATGTDSQSSASVREMKPPQGVTSAHQSTYFARYGAGPLTRSILNMLRRPSTVPVERARPFRICLSLMDRWEVGGLLIPEIFVPAMDSIFRYSRTASKDQIEEVLRSANIFFDGVESGLIWGKLIELILEGLDDNPSILGDHRAERLRLAKFVITRFSVNEEDMLLRHIPLAALATFIKLKQAYASMDSGNRDDREAHETALSILEVLTHLIPQQALLDQARQTLSVDTVRSKPTQGPKDTLQAIKLFYRDSRESGERFRLPSFAERIDSLLLGEAVGLFVQVIQKPPSSYGIESSTRILSSFIYKVPSIDVSKVEALFSIFQDTLRTTGSPATRQLPFPVLSAITIVFVSLQSVACSQLLFEPSQLPDLIHSLVAAIWRFLSPYTPKYHVEATRCLWQLERTTISTRYVEAAVTTLLSGDERSSHSILSRVAVDSSRRFAVLWTHSLLEKGSPTEKGGKSLSRRASGTSLIDNTSDTCLHGQAVLARPLLLLLDALAEDDIELSAFVKSWLQDLPSLHHVFNIIFTKLRSLRFLKRGSTKLGKMPGQHEELSDARECLYYIQHISNILKGASDHTWMTLAKETAPALEIADGQAASMVTQQMVIVQICMHVFETGLSVQQDQPEGHNLVLTSTALLVLQQILLNPCSAPLKELELEVPLLERLTSSLAGLDAALQATILATILAALKLRYQSPPPLPLLQMQQRRLSKDTVLSVPALSPNSERSIQDNPTFKLPATPPQLIPCLRAGFTSLSSRIVLDAWMNFLVEVLPLFADAIFQNLIPLVECFTSQIHSVFEQLQIAFSRPEFEEDVAPEATLISLMNGLEHILARAHDRLTLEEARSANTRSPEQPQGFFGNIVSGVFTPDSHPTRTATANSRLTVLLCFQDTVRICFAIWSWGGYGSETSRQDPTSIASFGYTSLRMRNRARRILEHVFAAETQECLETLAAIWCRPSTPESQTASVMSLLSVLNGSRPKQTFPAIFSAIYSRSNPSTLDRTRISNLTSELSDIGLAAFLVEYTRSLEDDAMDEIWADCMSFLRDVLTNPLPHRQILPALLEFTAMLAEKADNTNVGEQRRMRKELSDLFMRLLTATFTTRPAGFLQDQTQAANTGKPPSTTDKWPTEVSARYQDIVLVLTFIVPRLQLILVDNDRVATAVTNISNNLVGPALRSKGFPHNLTQNALSLLYQLSRNSQAAKVWKKDINDAFNDTRFFNISPFLAKDYWLPILQQWNLNTKDLMPELLSRLSAPTTAGIMFGVGATSARLEADRKAQLNLRRIAVLVLSTAEDTFVPNFGMLEEKLAELFTATVASSPSSATRAELFMLLRALALKTSPVHMAPLWPVVDAELQTAIKSVLPDTEQHDTYNNASVLQACKLLDTLVTLDPDDFQLHEWLFITDTIEAVYKPADWTPSALVDEVAEALSTTESATLSMPQAVAQPVIDGLRKPFLDTLLTGMAQEYGAADLRVMAKPDLASKVLRPFLGQLSIFAFEARYGMGQPDWEACTDGLLGDLFDEGGTVG